MSWSVSKSGNAEEVRTGVAEEIKKIDYLVGKEAEIKDAAGEFVDKVLEVTKADQSVDVLLNGHSAVVDNEQIKHSVVITIR